jgi:hypothetical protein
MIGRTRYRSHCPPTVSRMAVSVEPPTAIVPGVRSKQPGVSQQIKYSISSKHTWSIPVSLSSWSFQLIRINETVLTHALCWIIKHLSAELG